jgi:hypothetical protein
LEGEQPGGDEGGAAAEEPGEGEASAPRAGGLRPRRPPGRAARGSARRALGPRRRAGVERPDPASTFSSSPGGGESCWDGAREGGRGLAVALELGLASGCDSR